MSTVPPARLDWRDRLIPPSPVEAGPPAIVLGLTGDSGDGKTTAALSFPKPLVLHADANDGRLKASGVPYIAIGGGGSFTVFEREILPAIDRRDPWFETFDTIVLDSASFFQMDVREGIDFEDEKRSRGAYGKLKRDTLEPVRKVVKMAVAPRPGAKVWNVVVTCHRALFMKEIRSTGGQTKTQVPDGYKPLLEGASRDMFNAYFNTVISLRSKKVAAPGLVDGRPAPAQLRFFAQCERDAEYFAKDSIGGQGRYKRLPAEFDWTDCSFYDTLVKLWGM